MRRLEALDRRHRKMSAVIEERAADPKMQDVPGGDTGLLVHRVKSIGKGKHSRTIDLYHVDAALLKEMREIEKQAAIETGQWGEKMALVEDDPQASPNHYSIKDKRAFIIQILAELGCNISPADLEEGIHANQPPQLTAPVPKTPIIGY
jgi:hypothetical protein